MIKKIGLLFFAALMFTSCKKEEKQKEPTKKQEVEVVATNLPDVPSLNFNELEPYLNKSDGKIYVVNFWATWCAPCVKELPYFEKINKDYKDKNVEVLLVSLDFPKQKQKRLLPYISKNNIESKVVLLDDVNEQVWIPKISEDWSGAIPATLIYDGKQRAFFEKSFTLEELETELNKFIK